MIAYLILAGALLAGLFALQEANIHKVEKEANRVSTLTYKTALALCEQGNRQARVTYSNAKQLAKQPNTDPDYLGSLKYLLDGPYIDPEDGSVDCRRAVPKQP